MINTFIVEEHYEAYIIWKYAIMSKIMKQQQNILLHLDEHGDMGAAKLNQPLIQRGNSLQSIADFAYRELNIENFIVPAIFEGLFDEIIWVKQQHGQSSNRVQYEAVSEVRNGQMITKNLLPKSGAGLSISAGTDITKREFRFIKKHVNQITALKNVCLDIDLDFFSCIKDPLSTGHKIEITKAEYKKHLENPYNRLRYFEFGRVDVLLENKRYYYLLNNYSFEERSTLKVDKEIIVRRIDEAVERLAIKKIKPQLITICRSRHSGYTPPDQWEFIEINLLKKLRLSLGPIRTQHISEIISQ